MLLSKGAPDAAKLQEVDEELERIEIETDLQSEAIQSRQEEVSASYCVLPSSLHISCLRWKARA